MLSLFLLGAAFLGTVASTVFLGLAIAAAVRHRRAVPRQQAPEDRKLPGVSILKPLHGPEPRLAENLVSFLQQDYPAYEVIFCARHEDDAALAIARRVAAQYSSVPATFLTSGDPPFPNAKVHSLVHMLGHAKYDLLVMADSDTKVEPHYIREVTAPLLDSEIGVVTCLYRGIPTGGFWSGLEALGYSVEMASGVIIANMLEGMRFALGPTIATRKDIIDRIGGLSWLGDYCAEDFQIGQAAHSAGYEVVLSSYVLEHMVARYGFLGSWKHQLRWMHSTRYSRPRGHFGTGLTFAMPFGILGLASALLLGQPVLGLVLLLWAAFNRGLQAVIIGAGVARDLRCIRFCWMYPLRDLLGFLVWLASYGTNEILWRGERYRLAKGGRMVRRETAEHAAHQHLNASGS
jgi:ceramide glucosyltransferase